MSQPPVERYPIRRLLPRAGYWQLLAVLIAVVVIIIAPLVLKLVFGAMLAVGVIVRVLDAGYVELGPRHVTVRGLYFTRIAYASIDAIEPFEPRWEGWFGRLNKTLTKGFERIHSPEFIASNWPDYAVVLTRPAWILTFVPLPFPTRRRRVYLTIEEGHGDDFVASLREKVEAAKRGAGPD